MTFRPFISRVIQWLADTLFVPPVVTGIVCSVALGGFAFWIEWLTGTVDLVNAGRAPDIDIRAPVTLYVMVGYLPLAIYYLGVWTTDHFEMIVRNLALDQKPPLFPRIIANFVGVVGVGTMYFAFLHSTDDPMLLFQPFRWFADFALVLIGLVFMGWFNFRFMFLLVWSAIAISRTAQHIKSIDLLDTSSIKPYGQQGVRSSLLAIISLSISANLWLDPNAASIGSAITLITLIAAGLLALFLPTWGIHQRLKMLKQLDLERIRNAISLRRDLANRSVDDAQQLRTDLALEQRFLQISEWPFDAGSYGRVALYIFLGFGSWIGAALVERMLESL